MKSTKCGCKAGVPGPHERQTPETLAILPSRAVAQARLYSSGNCSGVSRLIGGSGKRREMTRGHNNRPRKYCLRPSIRGIRELDDEPHYRPRLENNPRRRVAFPESARSPRRLRPAHTRNRCTSSPSISACIMFPHNIGPTPADRLFNTIGRVKGRLMLPYPDNTPSQGGEPLVCIPVTLFISLDLRAPILRILFGPRTVFRTTVPETPINKNCNAFSGKYEIGLSL